MLLYQQFSWYGVNVLQNTTKYRKQWNVNSIIKIDGIWDDITLNYVGLSSNTLSGKINDYLSLESYFDLFQKVEIFLKLLKRVWWQLAII